MDISGKTLLSDRQLREQVIKLTQQTRKQLPGQASFTDIERCFGIQIYEDTLPMDKDGAYIEDGFKIIINNHVTSDERRQFTVYHELVHHLIREDEDLYTYLHDTYEDTYDFDRTIELLCNIGAAELILPRDSVRKLIETQGFTIGLVTQLCEQRCVSGPASMIQLVQNAPNRCYGVICDFGIPPNSRIVNQHSFIRTQQTNILYILYTMWSPSEKYSLARFTQIPENHLLTQALKEDSLVKGKDRIPFRSGTDWQVPVEAICFRGKVYGIFNVSPPPNHQQFRLL